jgi:hypothetical protein
VALISDPPEEELLMDVSIVAVGLLCPAGMGMEGAVAGRPGEVPGFHPRAWIQDRKSIKLMGRAVQLGVSAVAMTLAEIDRLEAIPPARRAMYVGANPLGGDLSDLGPSLEASLDADGGFDLERFATQGIPRANPLWLVKGLSNNVLGFASAIHDFQGTNANYCQGEASAVVALEHAFLSVAEGRSDLAVGGGSDSLLAAEALFPGRRLGEGAAFFALRPSQPGDRWRIARGRTTDPTLQPDEEALGHLGVAGPVVALARALLTGRLPVCLSGDGASLLVEAR